MDKNRELIKKANEKISQAKELAAKDYHRLKLHVTPLTGLLNDPNGFIQINGEYHLFYQLNPFDTKHRLKYWGHVRSKDLISWEQLPIALAPSEWYESHGCYSGSAVNNNGIFTLIYTGNVKDQKGNRETYQCIATSSNGVDFDKYMNNPVINNQPEGYTRHFRDPKVWKKDDEWYMVIGTQTVNLEGRALLFKSLDLEKWELIGEVSGSKLNGTGELGYMWECPDIFSLGDKDILITCPQGLEAQGDLYNNIYQAGYFVGKLDYSSGKLNHGEFTELDRGFEFYAPQTTMDEKGRRLLIAWMGLPEEEEHPTVEYGWIHAMTLPRVLKLVGDKVYQEPVEELKALRRSEVGYKNIIINNEEIELEKINGDVFELAVEFEIEDAEEFGINLRCSQDGKEKTTLLYDKKIEKFEFDRNDSGAGYKGVRRCALKERKSLKLRVFSDTSSLEIFINDGEEVFTGRIYPHKDSTGIKFFAREGSVKIIKIKKWDLN